VRPLLPLAPSLLARRLLPVLLRAHGQQVRAQLVGVAAAR